MQQLPLQISPRPQPGFDNFVPGGNAEALESVRSLAAQTLAERIVYLWGEPGSGRSHLLRAAAKANAALTIVDDVEALDANAQQALFAAINAARDGHGGVLAAGNAPPAQLPLRADVRTRLAWGLAYQLKPLSDADKAHHLKAAAGARGLEMSAEVAAYLLSRLPRDLSSLNYALDLLDRHSLARRRPLTIPLVREALAAEPPGEGMPRQTAGP